MGSLGVMDTKPRAFPPSALNILCNVGWLGARVGLHMGARVGLHMGREWGCTWGARVGLHMGARVGLHVGARVGLHHMHISPAHRLI